MRMQCCLCGRQMYRAAVLIGSHPVGPKCAKRAGLMSLVRRKSGLVFAANGQKTIVRQDAVTLDLFEVEVPC